MKNTENKKSKIERTSEDLFNFAIDREDVKWLMARLPPEADVKRTTVEYELQILKDRLDVYVAAMAHHPNASEPATVIGPEFSKACGQENNLFTFMTGSKMFISTTTKVRQYLEAIKLR